MFFINRGTVEVVSEDGSVVFATMTEGKFFGEISLVFSCPRTASIRLAHYNYSLVCTYSKLKEAVLLPTMTNWAEKPFRPTHTLTNTLRKFHAFNATFVLQ